MINTLFNKGIEVTSEMSVDEIVYTADLGWEVEKIPNTITYNGEGYATDSYTVINTDDPYIHYGVCKESWAPAQNVDIVDTFKKFCTQADINLVRVGSMQKGKYIFAIADLDIDIVLDEVDTTKNYILLVNSHSPGTGIRIKNFYNRLVCTNGMTESITSVNYYIKHSNNLTESKINHVLNLAKDKVHDYKYNLETLTKKSLTDQFVYTYVIEHFGDASKIDFTNPVNSDLEVQPRAVKKILDLYFGEAKGSDIAITINSAYGLFQAVTEYLNHHSQIRYGVDSHLNSLYFGSKGTVMSKTLKQLVSVSY